MILTAGMIIFSTIDDQDALRILSKSFQGIYKLLSSVLLTTSTGLSLLLTYIGISANSDSPLTRERYVGTKILSITSALLFILTAILFFWINSPFHESVNIYFSDPSNYYYCIIIILAFLMGLLLSIVIMITLLINDVLNDVAKNADIEN